MTDELCQRNQPPSTVLGAKGNIYTNDTRNCLWDSGLTASGTST